MEDRQRLGEGRSSIGCASTCAGVSLELWPGTSPSHQSLLFQPRARWGTGHYRRSADKVGGWMGTRSQQYLTWTPWTVGQGCGPGSLGRITFDRLRFTSLCPSLRARAATLGTFTSSDPIPEGGPRAGNRLTNTELGPGGLWSRAGRRSFRTRVRWASVPGRATVTPNPCQEGLGPGPGDGLLRVSVPLRDRGFKGR